MRGTIGWTAVSLALLLGALQWHAGADTFHGARTTLAAASGQTQQGQSVQFSPFPIERDQAERVSGERFVPDVSCTIRVNDVVPDDAKCTVDEDGEVSGYFRAPPHGDTVSVLVCQASQPTTDDHGDPCGLAAAGGDGFSLADPRPELKLTPSRVRPGDSVGVTGVDFLPDGVILSAPGVSRDVDNRPWGYFSTTLTVPDGTPPGSFPVRACSGRLCATSPLVVDPPPAVTRTSAPPPPPTGVPDRGRGRSSPPTSATPRPVPGASSGSPSGASSGTSAGASSGTSARASSGTSARASSGTSAPASSGTSAPASSGGSPGRGGTPPGAEETRPMEFGIRLVIVFLFLGWLLVTASLPERRVRRWARRHLVVTSRPGAASFVVGDAAASLLPLVKLVIRRDRRPREKGSPP